MTNSNELFVEYTICFYICGFACKKKKIVFISPIFVAFFYQAPTAGGIIVMNSTSLDSKLRFDRSLRC